MFSVIPLPYKILAVFVIILGAYFFGRHDGKQVSKTVIAQYESKVREADAKIADLIANPREKIVTKFVDRIKTIKEKEIKYVDVAKGNEADKDVILSSSWVCIHNAFVNDLDAKKCNNSSTP